jgi:hypothetical protein
LIDGLALGSAFLISTETGFLATLALISHDLPMKLSEFSIQLKSGFTRVETIKRNIFAAFATVIAAIFAYQFASNLELPMGYLYGGIAGFFIYIALSDIVPTIHSSEKARYGLQTGFLLFGLIFGGTVSTLAHEYIDVGNNHGEHSHALLEVNSSLPVPEISINVEEDKKSGYNLFLTTQNFTFNPDNASSEHVDGEGHAHLYINGEKITRLYSKAYYLGDFEKGSYTIVVELSSNDHSTLSKNGNPIQASFELVVGEASDTPSEPEAAHEHEEVLIQESNPDNENSSDNSSSELLPAYETIGCTTILNNLNELEVYTVAIERPFPGEVINGNYEVIGCSSAFEATVIWELLDQYGNIVDTYFTNGGSFEVDKFSFDLNTTEYVDGKYFLRVMETDPSDGESSLMLDQTLLPIYINNNIEEPKEEVSVEYFKISIQETVPELLQVIEVELDTKAVIQIESSIDTELHFHGYDIYLNIKSDEVTEIAFDFNIAGEFEVEDHEGGYEIARIIVKP